MTLADFSRAHAEQTKAYRRVQAFFQEFDLLLCPVTPVTPFPWTQLYMTHIHGEKPRTYFHWPPPTYRITNTRHPACPVPSGADNERLSFALQGVRPAQGQAIN